MRAGIIGAGLMGREAASCFGRWFALQDFPVRAELSAVCDLRDDLLEWFGQVPTVQLRTRDHAELLASENVDVVYVAVPHHLHEQLYCDVLVACWKSIPASSTAATLTPPSPPTGNATQALAVKSASWATSACTPCTSPSASAEN